MFHIPVVGRIGSLPILSGYLSNFSGSDRTAYPILKIWIGQDRIGNFFPSYPYPILAFVWPDFSLKILATNVKTLAIVVQLIVLICVIQQNLSFQIFNQEMHELHIFITLFLQSKTFSDKSVNTWICSNRKKWLVRPCLILLQYKSSSAVHNMEPYDKANITTELKKKQFQIRK